MASKIEVDEIMNAGGDNDSGIDLATNDAVKIKIANAVKAEVDSSGHVKLDTVKGYTSAASISVVGEGGSTTTNLQQGLSKAWINFNGSGTIATRDSFNISGNTDNSAGNYTPAYTNDFSNNDYTFNVTCANFSSGNSTYVHMFWIASDALATGNTNLNTLYVNGTTGGGAAVDSDLVMLQFDGDLA